MSNTAALAAIAITAARQAECKAVLGTFEAKGATIEQRREYASCVYTVDGTGKPMDPALVFLIKIAICIVLAFGVLGAYFRVDPDGPYGYDVGPVQGFMWGTLGGVCAIIALGLFFLALAFLFNL